MADNPQENDAGALPPKLDLRAKGLVKSNNQDAKPLAPKPAAPTPAPKPIIPKLINPSEGPPKPIPLTPATAKPAPAPAAAAPKPLAPKPLTTKAPAPKVSTTSTPRAPVTEAQTVHIKIPKTGRPSVAPAAAQKQVTSSSAPTIAAAPPVKKETSRIPLSEAKASPTIKASPPTDGPKTIRIKPKPATAQTQKVAQPGVIPGQDPTTDKRKTSRISLEAALASDAPAATAAPAHPKTIRLKRPSETATVKVSAKPGAAPPPAAESMTPSTAKLEETSRLDMPPVEEKTGTPTRRKTIRVKRPTQKPGVTTGAASSVAIAGATAGPLAAMATARAGGAVAAPVAEKQPHLTFSLFAIFTMLVIFVTIYLFSAQVFGPNPCLTELSYYKEGPDMGWPGKIPFSRP